MFIVVDAVLQAIVAVVIPVDSHAYIEPRQRTETSLDSEAWRTGFYADAEVGTCGCAGLKGNQDCRCFDEK